MDGFALTTRQRVEVAEALTVCQEVRQYRRLLALLEVDQGRPVSEIARSLLVSRQSVYTWLHAYQRVRRPEALAEHSRSGRPPVWSDLRDLLREWLSQSPEAQGYYATTWTVPLLREQVRHVRGRAVGERTVRQALHALGYTWKRARYVLEPDPAQGKKGDPHSPLPGPSGASERGAGGG